MCFISSGEESFDDSNTESIARITQAPDSSEEDEEDEAEAASVVLVEDEAAVVVVLSDQTAGHRQAERTFQAFDLLQDSGLIYDVASSQRLRQG